MQIADWLKKDRDKSNQGLLAVVERDPDQSDVVRVTPYRKGGDCACQSQLNIPLKYIASIEDTNDWCSCSDGPRRVSFVTLAASDDFAAERFLAQIHRPEPIGHRAYKPGTLLATHARASGTNLQGLYPGGFSPDDVLYESDIGFVLKSQHEYKCEAGTASWRQSIRCGTVFLGSSRIVLEDTSGLGINVGITGLCINCSSVVTLSPSGPTVWEAWFGGTFVVAYNSFVSWQGRSVQRGQITMGHR
jgi:hypothetical protein